MSVEKLIKQALSTFTKPQSYPTFQDNFNSLVQSTKKLTLNDVYLDKSTVAKESQRSQSPVMYVPVFENRHILVSMFILKPNAEIPLHDHPLMHGILKVLCGSVRIQSYSPRCVKRTAGDEPCLPEDYFYVEDSSYEEFITAQKSDAVVVGEGDDECGVLTPAHNNVHAVRCHEGPAVFLDILSPPYDVHARSVGNRKCTYFKETFCQNDYCMLSVMMHSPASYWTTEMPFKGPKILAND